MIEILINGDRVVVLNSGVYRIGRSATCDIHINDPSVSRCHATLDTEESPSKITDGDFLTGSVSANGLTINGLKIEPHHGVELAHGDEIRLSETTVLKYFETVEEADGFDPDTTLL